MILQEPPHFYLIFKGKFVVHQGGVGSGFKNRQVISILVVFFNCKHLARLETVRSCDAPFSTPNFQYSSWTPILQLSNFPTNQNRTEQNFLPQCPPIVEHCRIGSKAIYTHFQPINLIDLYSSSPIFQLSNSSTLLTWLCNPQEEDSFNTSGTRLFHVKASNEYNIRAIEVAAKAASLNSGDCFILENKGDLYLWWGILPCRGRQSHTM